MNLGTYAPSLLQGACILCALALAMTLCASVLYWHASALFDWHLLVTPSHLIAHPKICWVFSQHMWVHTTYVWRNNSSLTSINYLEFWLTKGENTYLSGSIKLSSMSGIRCFYDLQLYIFCLIWFFTSTQQSFSYAGRKNFISVIPEKHYL